MLRKQAINDLESEIYEHLAQAGKIANRELETDVSLENIQTKTWHLRKAAEAAEIAGWVKKEIASRLLELINKHNYNISRALVYNVLSPLGYSSNDSPVIGQHNSSINTRMAFETQNTKEIKFTEELIDFLKNTVLMRLSTGSYLDRILLQDEIMAAKADLQRAEKTGDTISIDSAVRKLEWLENRSERNRRIYEDHCYVREKLLADAKQAWDNRHSVTILKQHELLKRIEIHNVAGGAELFEAWVKDISLTPKQAHKYKIGEVRELLPIYDPKNRDEAIRSGFYGMQCTRIICKSCEKSLAADSTICENDLASRLGGTKSKCTCQEFEPCKSWRVKLDRGGGTEMLLHCFACLGTFRPVTLPLPRTESTVIGKKMQEMFGKTYPEWKKQNKID